jgi:lipopolysaccharide transport system ATP-binding protein
VGDAHFQKKCLNKMQDVGQQGRTVLFVSHSMLAIARLCKRVILLDEGRIQIDGPSHEVVSKYLNCGFGTTAAREWPDLAEAPGDDVARLCAVRVRTDDGRVTDTVDIRKPVGIEIEYEVLKSGYVMFSHFQLFNQEGVHIFSAHDVDSSWRRRSRPAGRYTSTGWIPGNLLSEGTMLVGAGLLTLEQEPPIKRFYEHDAVAFQVIDNHQGDSARGDYTGSMDGMVRPLLNWTTQLSPNGTRAAVQDS